MGNNIQKRGSPKRQNNSFLKVFKSNNNEQDKPNTNSIWSEQELCVYGFIRRIQQELLSKYDNELLMLRVIPLSMYELCYKYSRHSNSDYLYLWCSSSVIKNHISFINIKDIDNKVYGLNLKRITYGPPFYDKKFSAGFLVNNISKCIIPKQYKQRLNGMEISGLFRIGGKFVIPEEFSSKCNVILFNSPYTLNMDTIEKKRNYSIDAYIGDLPNMIEPKSCVASIFNPSQNIIYNIGGLNNMKQIQKKITSLNMNHWNSENEDFKWKTHEMGIKKRYETNINWIGSNFNDHDNIIVCGGCTSWISPTTHCEMIQFDDNNDIKDIVELSPMNHERAFVGSFQCESNKIVIGGGILRENSAYTIEFYDGNVNRWIEYPQKTNFRHDQAIMWCDTNNYNIIYIGGHTLNYSYLGTIEWIDIRDSCHCWHTLTNSKYQSNFEQLFALSGHGQIAVDYWNRRHLVV